MSENEFCSYLMYPPIFLDFVAHQDLYGDVSILETPVFFYGLKPNQEISVDIEQGKTLYIRFLAKGDLNEKGTIDVFFELNGQSRISQVEPEAAKKDTPAREKADPEDRSHIGAPIPAAVSKIEVKEGQKIKKGDVLMVLEAMKMETLVKTPRGGKIKSLKVKKGDSIEAGDLIAVLV